MMFKILVLQRLYNLSDDQTEYQINDRRSFMRFLELALCDTAPDAKKIWKFKNDLAQAEAIDYLFRIFDAQLEKEGLITHNGTIIDATFVDAPKQRNSRDENKKIKNGKVMRYKAQTGQMVYELNRSKCVKSISLMHCID